MTTSFLGENLPATLRIYLLGLASTGVLAALTSVLFDFTTALIATPVYAALIIGSRYAMTRVTIESTRLQHATHLPATPVHADTLGSEKGDQEERRVGKRKNGSLVHRRHVRSVSLQVRDYQVTVKIVHRTESRSLLEAKLKPKEQTDEQ